MENPIYEWMIMMIVRGTPMTWETSTFISMSIAIRCQVLEVSSSAPFLALAQESYGALPKKSWELKDFREAMELLGGFG